MVDLIFNIENSFDENVSEFRKSIELIDKDLTTVLFKHINLLKADNQSSRSEFNHNVLMDIEDAQQTEVLK